MGGFEQTVRQVRDGLDAAVRAHAANDVEAWREARARLDLALRGAAWAQDRARGAATAASAEARSRITVADGDLEALQRAASTASEPPTGARPVAREAEIEAVLAAPISGSAAAGHARKEAELRAELDLLSPADSKLLAARLRAAHPRDRLAELVGGLTAERRRRVLAFLDGARRRQATRRGREVHDGDRSAAVQRAATAAETPTAAGETDAGDAVEDQREREPEPRTIAASGVRGPGGPLPHLDRIQTSFGRHDVSAIRAHVGAAAAGAATALGAQAYTFGDDVAFAGEADLHTAAHEAAHVVQQRAGLSSAGAQHERHADDVADAVVRGESAEALLDPFAAGGGGGDSGQRVVQRKTDRAPASPGRATTPIYVNTWVSRILGMIGQRIREVGMPQPHPGLHWRELPAAQTAIIERLWDFVMAAPDIALKRLMMLSYPADLFAIIEDLRRGPAGAEWLHEVGIAVANAFTEPLDASIRRMGMRFVVQLDGPAGGNPRQVLTLVKSHPLDFVVAGALTTPGLVSTMHGRRGSGDTPGRPFVNGTRTVEYSWQGERDPALWNWIRVSSPANPTAEDVASTPLLGEDTMGAEQVYRIAASPPFFGIPFEIARQIPEAARHAPGELLLKLATGPGPRVADPGALERSAVSDDAALAQARARARQDLALEPTLQQVSLQLDFLRGQLSPWRAAAALAGASSFAERRRADLARDGKAASKWTAVVASQERILHAAASDLAELLEDLRRRKATPADAGALRPVITVMTAYARAAGASHLAAEAPALLAEARRARALLPLTLTEDQIRLARRAIVDQQAAEAATGQREPSADATIGSVTALMTRAADLRLHATRGDKLDPDAADQLGAEADEVALRARLLTLATTVRDVRRRADEVGVDAGRSPSGAWSPQMVADLVLAKIYAGGAKVVHGMAVPSGWQQQLEDARRWTGPDGDRTQTQTMTARLRKAVRAIEHDLATFARTLGVDEYLRSAYDQIKDQQLHNLLKSMALQIAVMVATGELIGVAGVALRGIALAGQLATDMRGAAMLYKGIEVMAHAGLATAVQGAMGGPAGGRELVENAVGIVLSRAAMKPFEGLLASSAAVEHEIRGLGKLALSRAGKLGAEIAIGTSTGVLASGMARALTHDGQLDAASHQEWTTQGVALAVSSFVARRTRAMQQRIELAARQLRTTVFDKLLPRVRALRERAEGAKHPSPDEAMRQLADSHALLRDEKPLYTTLTGAGAARARTANQAELDVAGARFADVPLQLARLSPVVDGHIYLGTEKQIRTAFKDADTAGIPLARTQDPQTGAWTVTSGDRTLVIHERGWKPAKAPPPPSTAPAARVDGDLAHLGARIASQVPDVTYQPGGTFTIAGAPEAISVEIKRTSGQTRVVRNGNTAVIEVPRGLRAGDFERIVVARLGELRARPARAVISTDDAIREARELDRIREGTPGRIRPASELSNQDVVRSLNAQLQPVKPGDVDRIIQMFPAADQLRARSVLARASGFGTMESLNVIRTSMQPHLARGGRLFLPGRGSLADNIAYVASKGSFKGVAPDSHEGQILTTSKIESRTLVILDHVVLDRIRTDPSFAKALVDNKASLLEPRGFGAGINMFNGVSPEKIAERTTRLLRRSQQIHEQANGKLPFDDAITKALDEATIDTLSSADARLVSQIEVVDAAAHPETSSAAISARLTGNAGINAADLEAVLASTSETNRAYARELLAHEAQVYSPRRIAAALAEQHERFAAMAAQQRVKPADVYFYIPQSAKSYGMVAMAHREATDTPVSQYVNGPNELKARKLGRDTMLVVLDDVAGTGSSLEGAVLDLNHTRYQGHIVVSPIISSEMATGLFMGSKKRPAGLVKQQANLAYEPAALASSLEQSPFFKQLSATQQETLRDFIQSAGYMKNALSIAFPYMAPDNNNQFFGDQVAKYFIANQNGQASKADAWTPPELRNKQSE